jgi:hypothetical protein
MQISYGNPCSRCGTQRILLKSSREKIGNSVVITTQKICPNPGCQKIVDQENKKQKDRNAARRLNSENRALQRRAVKDEERSKK